MNFDLNNCINVGLVGHVANGKTTLVQKLSGVNTKKNSQEIKSGKTIKLGYANCIIWHCLVCDAVRTTGEKEEKEKCCDGEKEMEAYKISFIDAPGHHSYVHTMIKGTSVMDCAIVMTDVRVGDIQPQTMEHLLILKILGIQDMIIVQNKIDLVSLEECKKNYEMIKEKIPGYSIIPMSAQTGKGIEMFQRKLFEMVKQVGKKREREKETNRKNIFSIIRSFDVNKPGPKSEIEKGGVIGGSCIEDNDFQIGDEVYILPMKKQTIIKSIYSETLECKKMNRGGLYGVGTDLNGEITKADNLVGCVMVKDINQVLVVDNIELKLHRLERFLDDSLTPKINVGSIYQVMIGNVVVKGLISKYNQSKYTITFPYKICILGNTCILYTLDSKLFAYGYFTDRKDRNDRNDNGERGKEDTLKEKEIDYESLFRSDIKETKKQTLPAPSLFRENRNIIWANMGIFCQSIKREPEMVTTFVKEELCIDASLCREGLRIFKSNINSSKFQVILRKYVKEKVSCGQCKSVDTIIKKNSARAQEIHCNKCGSIRNIN